MDLEVSPYVHMYKWEKSSLLSQRRAQLSSSFFRQTWQNFRLKWPGSDQQWATGVCEKQRRKLEADPNNYMFLLVFVLSPQSLSTYLDMGHCHRWTWWQNILQAPVMHHKVTNWKEEPDISWELGVCTPQYFTFPLRIFIYILCQ
jgi:hypothetical protein